MQCPSLFSADTQDRLVLRTAGTLTSVVQLVEAQSHVGRYTLMHCVQKANALTLIVWKKHALALIIWKAYAMWCVVRTPHALTLGIWMATALALVV